MRKINKNYENPFDDLLIDMAEYLSPYLKKCYLTPNDITFLSLITGILSIFFLFNNMYEYSILYLFLSYFFDIFDGNYARKYKMETEFGDLYDHIKDLLVSISIFSLLLYKTYIISIKLMIIYFVLIIIFFILMNIHLGCQERIYDNNDNNIFLNNNKFLCKKKKYILYTKYVGCGTFNLVIFMLIYNLKNYKKIQ